MGPTEIFPQVDIDHTSHGVRTVNGRSARLQNFDALNRRERDGIDIDKGATEHSGNTAPVQQDQAGSGIQSRATPPRLNPTGPPWLVPLFDTGILFELLTG